MQFIIFFGWYKFILAEEFKYKNIVRRSIQILVVQRKNIIYFLFRRGSISEEQKKAICNIKNHLLKMFIEACMLIVYFILAPVFLNLIINYENRWMLKNLFYIVFLCILIWGLLKEDTQKIIEIINAYAQNVMIPLEKKPELLSFEDVQKPVIKWHVKTLLILLLGLLVAIITIFISYRFKDNKVFLAIIVVMFMFLMIHESSIVFHRNNRASVEGIYVEGYILESVKTDIEEMCELLKIKYLDCKIVSTEEVYVESKINERGIPQIDISNGFITQIYGNNARDILLLTIAHELGHIYYNDFSNIKKRVRNSNLLHFILWILNMLVLIAAIFSPKFSPIFLIVMLFVIAIERIFGKVMSDERFWKQIAELRADRLAINVCKSNKMIIVEFWKEYLEKQDRTETNRLDQFYRRYIKIEGHPSMEYRMKLIEKREKWSWWEYFEHAVVIMKWYVTNKGWNGV